MQLNLPILGQLAEAERILVAGAGGGFDIYAGLPLIFSLREAGKTVHIANYSFMDTRIARKIMTDPVETPLGDDLLGVRGELIIEPPYFPEGFLADWFHRQGQDETIWMFPAAGVVPLREAYQHLIDTFDIDAVLLVDGGVDSLARGNEEGPGTMVEDTISLVALQEATVAHKLLATIGFGTEVEENLDHHAALENMANIIKQGGFYGACALTPQMPVFQRYEAACRHAWEGENRHRSHISTRIIPAVQGESGNYHMYPSAARPPVFISPLMALYWFFDADVVVRQNYLADSVRETYSKDQARAQMLTEATQQTVTRPRRRIPY